MKYARSITAALLAAAAITLAGCGGGAAPSGHEGMHHPAPPEAPQVPSSAPHNQADVAFAQGMIPHHKQAVDMARLAPSRAASAEVKQLAQQIEAAQGPEIATMTSWLQNWGAPMAGHGGHAGHGMGGMMTEEEMRQLNTASGTEFDRLFLGLMIKHHEGAVAMAETELAQGQDPAAKQLAQRIIDTQRAEIQHMQRLIPQG